MYNETEGCQADCAEECQHIGDARLHIRLKSVEQMYKWRKHADEYFAGPDSNPPHPGNISKMVRTYVGQGMLQDGQLPGTPASPEEMDDTVDVEKERLKEENEQLKAKVEELRRVIEQLSSPDHKHAQMELGFLAGTAVADGAGYDTILQKVQDHVDEEALTGPYNDNIKRPKALEDILDTRNTTEILSSFLMDMTDTHTLEVTHDDGQLTYQA